MDRNRIIKALQSATIKPDGARAEFLVAEQLGRGGNGAAFVVRSSRKELVAKFYVPPDSRDLDEAAFKRFQREIQLAVQLKHPYVIKSEGVGSIQVGSYRIPFYLMRRATGTMREMVPESFDFFNLDRRLRVFTRTLQGVSYLHHLGIVHRDLKPENVLLFDGDPKIADLGIAHVTPGFNNWSHLTVPKERLMNRDYYAPEQRHGDATKVDHRADIYALGCMLYEIISGISPTRPNLPPLEDFHRDLAPLDRVLGRMYAHAPEKRYQSVDGALDDLLWALVHTGIPTSAPSTEEDDEKELIRLLKSTNAANQAKAMEPAMRLGTKALPILHEHTGQGRLDVAIGAYRILGDISHESSVPYLIAGLYPRRTGKKPQFATGQYAAAALCRYPTAIRLGVLESLNDQVRAENIAMIIDGIEPGESFYRVLRLYLDGKFYHDWADQSGLSLLLRIDQDRSWPIVEGLMNSEREFYSFMVFRDIYPFVNTVRQQMIIDHYLDRAVSLSSYELPKILAAAVGGAFSNDYVSDVLHRIAEVAEVVFKRYSERIEFFRRLQQARDQIGMA
jgi:serine/threonine protein kinase